MPWFLQQVCSIYYILDSIPKNQDGRDARRSFVRADHLSPMLWMLLHDCCFQLIVAHIYIMSLCSVARQTAKKEVNSITRLSVSCARTAITGETKSFYIYSHKTLIAYWSCHTGTQALCHTGENGRDRNAVLELQLISCSHRKPVFSSCMKWILQKLACTLMILPAALQLVWPG